VLARGSDGFVETRRALEVTPDGRLLRHSGIDELARVLGAT
jgi:hypothetical protein